MTQVLLLFAVVLLGILWDMSSAQLLKILSTVRVGQVLKDFLESRDQMDGLDQLGPKWVSQTL